MKVTSSFLFSVVSLYYLLPVLLISYFFILYLFMFSFLFSYFSFFPAFFLQKWENYLNMSWIFSNNYRTYFYIFINVLNLIFKWLQTFLDNFLNRDSDFSWAYLKYVNSFLNDSNILLNLHESFHKCYEHFFNNCANKCFHLNNLFRNLWIF